VGAGNVLKKQDDTICKNNIDSITRLLKEKHIPVRASVLGGTERKGISLDIKNGSVYYTEGDREEKMLWKSAEKITQK
jgi:chemotaxis receptor (MCP) glutamine deamidase CheD